MINQSDALFCEFVNALNEAKSSYCILKNYETLPDTKSVADIDFLIKEDEIEKCRILLYGVAGQLGFKLFNTWKRQYGQQFQFFKIDGGHIYTLVIDFLFNEEHKGAIYMDGSHILKERIFNGQFYHSNPIHHAIINWLHPIVHGSFYKAKYEKRIMNYFDLDRKMVQEQLRVIYGVKLAELLLGFIKCNRLGDALTIRKKLVRYIHLNSLKNNPISYALRGIKFYYYELLIRTNPTGKCIAIIGPDGSGKSTVAAGILEEIGGVVHSDLNRIIHLRPGFLPDLKNIFKPWKWRSYKKQGIVSNPHAAQPSGPTLSMVRLLYYFIDYTLGYYLTTYKFLVRNAIIIFDRYYYDTIVDPIRSRIKLPYRVLLRLLPFIPKPDITIFLDTNPEILFQRKAELSLLEFNRQIRFYRKLLNSLPNAYQISTEREIDDVVSEASRIILKKSSEGNENRADCKAGYLIGADVVEKYYCIPSRDNCRWIIPAGPRELAKRSWDLYQPYGRKGQLYKRINRLTTAFSYYKCHRWAIASSDIFKSSASEAIRKKLEEIFGGQNMTMALSLGTPSPFRKITGLVMTKDGTALAYVKLGETALAIERIKYEAKMLSSLNLENRNVKVKIATPECLYEGVAGNAYALIQRPAPFDGKNGGRSFNADYLSVLQTLSANATTIKLSESRFYNELYKKLNFYCYQKDLLERGMEYIANNASNEVIPVSLAHGDFAPWNMVWNKNNTEVFLYDWEAASTEAPTGLDLVHFSFQTGFLLKKLRGDFLLRHILKNVKASMVITPFKAKILSPATLIITYLLHMAGHEDVEDLFSPVAIERRSLLNILLNSPIKARWQDA